MSKLLITKYYNQLHDILNAGGTRNETSITFAFANLLRSYAEKKNLLLVEQKDVIGRSGKRVIPDGTLKYFGGIDVGYWEAKDTNDNLNDEINIKLNEKGYPNKNIIFEDTQTAVLIQEGAEVMRVSMREWNLLDDLLDKFVDYQPAEVSRASRICYSASVPKMPNESKTRTKRKSASSSAIRRITRIRQTSTTSIKTAITKKLINALKILTSDIQRRRKQRSMICMRVFIAGQWTGWIKTALSLS